MPITAPKVLVAGHLVDDASDIVYTAPSNTTAMVTYVTAHNTDASAVLLEAWIGTSATDATKRCKVSIAAGATLDGIEGINGEAIGPGEKLIFLAGVVDKVSVRVIGIEMPST